AQLLRQSAAKNPAARYEVAQHYAAAGHLKEAKSQALSAAQYAKSLGAVRERANAIALAMSVEKKFEPALGVQLGECLLDLREFQQLESLLAAVARTPMIDAESSAAFEYLEIATALGTGRADLCQVTNRLELLLARQPRFLLEPAARTMLMRAAYRSGSRETARQAAKIHRKQIMSRGHGPSGHALLSTGYVAAKYFSPKRALPLLRQALIEAQKTRDLDLEHLCRQGLGAVCRQIGKFRDSIAECELALALAQRTLSPVLAAHDASDLAVAEMALGNCDRANQLFEEAATVLEQQPDRHGPGFVRSNQGELLLDIGDIDRAWMAFSHALEPATERKDLPIALQTLAGLALCAQRRGYLPELEHWCAELRSLGMGRHRMFHERWMIEAALAWDVALNQRRYRDAIDQLRAGADELRRRDVDHWLLVELEALRLVQYCSGGPSSGEVDRLWKLAVEYEAGTVLRGLATLSKSDTGIASLGS
ncbi:MAG: hypothetical protein ACHP7P_14705, partial [Terriglobales bacterium]